MTGYQIIHDLQRVTALEARSAQATAPTVNESERPVRTPRLATLRLQATVYLRRLADALEPAPLDTVPSCNGSGC
jgi:hypothetical protein